MEHQFRTAAAIFLLLIVASITLVVAAQLSSNPVFASPDREGLPRINVGGVPIYVYVVESPQDRQQGLSGRRELPRAHGMLFVFPREHYYKIWMKDMRFSIDIIWISEDGRVVDVKQNVSPDTYPEAFAPRRPAMYVLEVNAGFAEKNSITVGDRAIF